ncbi:carbohydrate ABC transporter permease [Muricomes intestini]|uniref:carbohydrate ABC transporter permease n=1 Tax=Muricomes intestini TaxID=1796634 RepID=UPI0026D1B81F
MKKKNRVVSRIVLHIALIFLCFVVAFPFLWMLTNSIKTKDEIWKMPPSMFPEIAQWNNYKEVFSDGMFLRYIWNSSYTAVICTIIVLINSALFAYALTYIHFKGKKVLFTLIMATYIMPSAATHIPSYMILSRTGLMNTHAGYIISSSASIFNIFFFMTVFSRINLSIINAAKVDGAGHWQIFWRIVAPMSASSFVTLGLLSFIGNYNNYLWPSLILRDKEKYFVSMGLRSFFSSQGAYGMKWGTIMAACCCIIIPLLLVFFFCEKWIINGITSDAAVKE